MKTYNIDIDFYSMGFKVSAKNKVDARRKAKAKIKAMINSHINNLYIDEA